MLGGAWTVVMLLPVIYWPHPVPRGDRCLRGRCLFCEKSLVVQLLLSSRFELRFVNTRDAAAARFGRDAQTRRDPGSFIHFAVINRFFFSLPPHNVAFSHLAPQISANSVNHFSGASHASGVKDERLTMPIEPTFGRRTSRAARDSFALATRSW